MQIVGNKFKIDFGQHIYQLHFESAIVIHLQDYEQGIVYSNITINQDVFLNLKGTLSSIK